MKHATADTLSRLEPLLKKLRANARLKEKKNGIYYFKSKAFLHFHEEADEIFADVKKSRHRNLPA